MLKQEVRTEGSEFLPSRKEMLRITADIEKEVKRLMATGMSEAEARETAEYDYEIEHGGKDLEYDLTKEQQKVAKKMTSTGTRKKKAEFSWQKKERKPDEEKRDLISKLFEFIAEVIDGKAVVSNKERQIDFVVSNNNYSITLTRHRPPKEK